MAVLWAFLLFLTIGVISCDDEHENESKCKNIDKISICIDFFGETFEIRSLEDNLCPEFYPMMSCLHDFVKEEFPNTELIDDYLCKMRGFKERVQFLCHTEQNYGEIVEGSGSDEENVGEHEECLNKAERDAQKCYNQKAADLVNVVEGKGYLLKTKKEYEKLKCTLFEPTLECLKEKLRERCDEDIVNSYLKRSRRRGSEHLGEECIQMTLHDFEFKNESTIFKL